MKFHLKGISVATAAAILAACGGGGTGENDNRLSVNAGEDRTVEPDRVVFVQGAASNKDSHIESMTWRVKQGDIDDRTSIEIVDGGRCVFETPDEEGEGERDFGVEDDKTCAAAVALGPFAEDRNVVLELTARETGGLTRSDDMRLAIRANPDAVVANAGSDRAVEQDGTLQHDCTFDGGFFFDRENPQPRYNWSVANQGDLAADGVAVNHDFDPDTGRLNLDIPFANDGTEIVMACEVTDDADRSDTDSVRFTVNVDMPVEVTAGEDQEASPGDLVDLSATVNDPNNDNAAVQFSWVQLAGTEVEINAANSRNASFMVPFDVDASEDLVFEFRASRDIIDDSTVFADSERDRTTVELMVDEQEPQPLVADAGAAQQAISGEVVELDGSVTDPEGNGGQSHIEWVQLEGVDGQEDVFLSGANTAAPSFIAPNVTDTEELIFEMRVSREPIDGDTEFAASERSATMVEVSPASP